MTTRGMTLALGLLAFAGLSMAIAEEAKEFKATCPMSGKPAKEECCVDYMGKKVYFCCGNCMKAFSKDEKQFAAKANCQLLETGQICQVGCPFSGGPVNPKTMTKVGDVEVGFCCPNCQAKVKKAEDPVALVFANIAKGFTTQCKCPISGKPIDPKISVEHDGKKAYFCCEGCPDEFKKDPAKYESKLK